MDERFSIREYLHARLKKGKRRGEGKRKEKKKEKECRSSTYDAAVNRLMAMQKGRQGSNIARHSVCCIILK